jgi:hypothetical protein
MNDFFMALLIHTETLLPARVCAMRLASGGAKPDLQAYSVAIKIRIVMMNRRKHNE